MSTAVVVVGGGLAGATAVTELRERGHSGTVTLIGAEPHLPYERPPLSKGYLMGNDPIEDAFVHDSAWYDEHDVRLLTGVEATRIDREQRVVETTSGNHPYDALILATGASPRHLRIADEAGVPTAYLRTIEDSDRIRSAFGPGHRIVFIGAGWIGLEVAAAARLADTEVVVYEMAEQPLLHALGPRVGKIFADVHRSHGVDLHLGAQVSADDLRDAELVVVGAGAVPNVQLAEQAGLVVDNGVLVDAQLRTSDSDIYAIGDIANHDHPVLGHRIRVEHWDTAIEQAKVAAHNVLGANEAYERRPYFFTDQYDLGMEYFGHGSGDDEVVIEGDPPNGPFRVYWVADQVVTAAMHVNDWDASDELRDQVGRPLERTGGGSTQNQ